MYEYVFQFISSKGKGITILNNIRKSFLKASQHREYQDTWFDDTAWVPISADHFQLLVTKKAVKIAWSDPQLNPPARLLIRKSKTHRVKVNFYFIAAKNNYSSSQQIWRELLESV